MIVLLEVTKIQILKVIHNNNITFPKFWKVVGSHKDTNFESNSQQVMATLPDESSCWKSQRYKF